LSNAKLNDEGWMKILAFLRTQEGIYIGLEEECRRFVEAVLWILRSGAQWRLLPATEGQWNSVFKRFDRWGKRGIWVNMHRYFAAEPDSESVMGDSTVVRAHACAAGAAADTTEPPVDQALGRSKGGFSTKIHVLVDGLGNPLDFRLTGGQAADVTQAIPLLEGHAAQYALFDKAYDADSLLDWLRQQGFIPVIPPKSNRKEQRAYDKHIYKERHLVECCIGKLKQFRRVFSRFEKTAANFMSFIRFASALIWLR
jgi:transposase